MVRNAEFRPLPKKDLLESQTKEEIQKKKDADVNGITQHESNILLRVKAYFVKLL